MNLETSTIVNRERMVIRVPPTSLYINDVIDAILKSNTNVLENIMRFLEKLDYLDFLHSALVLALADPRRKEHSELITKACKTISVYESEGLSLRYRDIDSYFALLLYILEKKKHKEIEKVQKGCFESFVNVLERNMEDLNKLDKLVAKTIISIARGEPKKVRSYLKECYNNISAPSICLFFVLTAAYTAGIAVRLGEIANVKDELQKYINRVERRVININLLRKYLIERRGKQILDRLAVLYVEHEAYAKIITLFLFVVVPSVLLSKLISNTDPITLIKVLVFSIPSMTGIVFKVKPISRLYNYAKMCIAIKLMELRLSYTRLTNLLANTLRKVAHEILPIFKGK